MSVTQPKSATCRKCGPVTPDGSGVCPKCFRTVTVAAVETAKVDPVTATSADDLPAAAPYVSSELDLITLPAAATGLPDCLLIDAKPKKPSPYWRLTPRVYVRFRAAVEARLKATDPKRAVSPGEGAILPAKLDAVEHALKAAWPGATAAIAELLPIAGKIEIAKPPIVPKWDVEADDFWEQT